MIAPTQDPSLIDVLRVDQRLHRGNWCNQPGGIGARPQAQPDNKPWIHAYLWVKRPGESDGPADDFFDGNDFNYLRNPWCVPDNLIERPNVLTGSNLAFSTGALPDAPLASRWFTTGFAALIENAWPPLCEGKNDICE